MNNNLSIFIEKLKQVHFSGDTSTTVEDIKTYSKDASFFSVKPEIILFPKNTQDIIAIVQATNTFNKQESKKISLTARAAGTCMSGGGLTESVVISFTKYFNQFKGITDTGIATTELGIFYRDFEKETLKKNFILPSYPASRDLCALGGIVANNSGGEKTLQYGKTEDYVTELEIILHDGSVMTTKKLSLTELETKKKLENTEGKIYRDMHDLLEKNYDAVKKAKPDVSKNSAGYYLWNVYDKQKGTFDLTKLFVGSQGTLGIITEAKLQLVQPKKYSRLVVAFLKDMKELGHITNTLLAFKPESLESYDDHTFALAVKLFPAMLKKLKGNALVLAWRFLPEFWSVITGGIPKLVLMAEFTADSEQEAQQQAEAAQKSLEQYKLTTKIAATETDIGKYWTIRRESFSMLRNHIKTLRTAPFIDDFVVKPEFLPEFLPKLYKILDAYPITYTIAGHVGSGNFHIIPLMDFTEKNNAQTKKYIDEIMHTVINLILEYKGSITGEHNDGIVRTPFLTQMYGKEITDLFQKTKKIFDPENVFNPGKKVDGTWEYALNHVIKE
jgi:FAD/FMN-containing dehydrogenase